SVRVAKVCWSGILLSFRSALRERVCGHARPGPYAVRQGLALLFAAKQSGAKGDLEAGVYCQTGSGRNVPIMGGTKVNERS
ncbi:MAG TPA: hypothetical protein VN065_16155, partial [Bradyrhizobium sp.]|nr:hypothetical protein [Bradyrhizobium sp.]